MLGRKNYTVEEFGDAKATFDRQLAAYRKLVKSVEGSSDAQALAALRAFEPLFFNNMVLALDRFFVHRLRTVTGKDGNPLNELELLSESLLKDGVFRGKNVIKLQPADTVLGLAPGDQIKVSQAEFERLYKAFMSELEARFVAAPA